MGTHPVWFERPVIPELERFIPADVERLGPGTDADPFAGVEPATGVVASVLFYNDETLDLMPNVRVISRTGIGVDRVDLAAATARGIAVCNTPDAPTVSTAEQALALMLAAAKRIARSVNRLNAGETNLYARHDAVELDGKTLGLVGFGRIARKTAAGARGMGMRIATYDPYLDTVDDDVRRAATLDELLGTADVVSVHVPLSKATRHMFDAAAFAAMKPRAIFVNTARGGLVDQDALLEALDSGRLFAAGLDVTDPEPLPTDHPLLHRDDVVVTPHVASGTAEGKARIFAAAVENTLQVLRGERPVDLVNPDVWNHFTPSKESER